MAKDPVKANLFRFVTLRNPQLIDEKEKDPGFVFNPYESNNAFYNAVENLEDDQKPAALKTVSDGFSGIAYRTRAEIKPYCEGLYSFSSWLMRNKKDLSYKSIKANLGDATTLNPIQESSVWNNLIYQTVTKKSVYVREACIQLLIANKFLNAFNNLDQNKPVDYVFTEDELKELTRRAHASVIISKVLFSASKTQEASKYSSPNKSYERDINIAAASFNIAQYKKLRKELKKAEEQFNKDYQAAYDEALDAHKASVQNIIDETEPTIIERVDELGNVTKIETYPGLKLPEFNFKQDTLIDEKYLEDKISEDAANVLTDKALNVYTEFSSIYTQLDDLSNEANRVMYKNKAALKEKSIQVNGAKFKTTETRGVNPYCYKVKYERLAGLGNGFLMKMVTDYSNASVTDATFKVTYNPGGQEVNGIDTHMQSTANGWLVVFFQFPPLLLGAGVNLTFSGEYVLDNGNTYSFSATGSYSPRLGFFSHGCSELVDGDTSGTTNPQVIAVNETVYGVTNLGIADFRRVEQEVCCYVPGEVSHIENVMAREYKERSTRSLVSSEITNERTEERERENLTDTTTTERNEMQSEVASVLNEDQAQSYGTNASVTASWGKGSFSADAHADFSSSSSTSNSNSQAQTYAQEVTERAMERIVQKTQTKRTSRILKEFEENNSHGFDNRKGDQHISGVYRWVDKIYKNKLINYGKRLMYEFAIPEPSKFFKQAIIKDVESGTTDSAVILPTAPIHPSQLDSSIRMDSAADLDENNYQNIAAEYGAEVNSKPAASINVNASFGVDFSGHLADSGAVQLASGKGEMDIPEGYKVTQADYAYSAYHYGYRGTPRASVTIGGKESGQTAVDTQGSGTIYSLNAQKKLGYSFSAGESPIMSGSIKAYCIRTSELVETWQNETYNAIMEAYYDRLREYNEAVQAEEVIPESTSETLRFNPLQNRAIEKRELKRIAIELLAEQKGYDVSKYNYLPADNNDISKVNKTAALQTHAATVKFFEQAFDWEIMAYIFYPYFYANEGDWKDLFQQQDAADPIFQTFLQSGMARTVVPVRKGFEDAVNWYMITGEIWNGEGLVVDTDDELYLSVAEEMQSIEGEVEGTWETRLPTSLTVIQAGSIGLNVEGLPCNSDCETGSLFDSDENPIVQTGELVGGTEAVAVATARLGGKIIGAEEGVTTKVVLKTIDGATQNLTYTNAESGTWELDAIPAGRYELLLDADNDFPDEQYQVIQGQKDQVVELQDGQGVEVNLEVKRL